MSNIVDQQVWDAGYADMSLTYRPETVLLQPLLDRFLPKGGTCFEVGCYPGSYLVYLAKRFGYVVSGIDMTPFVEDRLPELFRREGVPVGEIVRGDFLTYEPPVKFDVVFSVGFIEHFTNFEEVIRKHVELLKPGGTLLLMTPNFRRVQFLLHRLLDRENLERHVLAAMDLASWTRVMRECGMEVLDQGYYRTSDFWIHDPATAGFVVRKTTGLIRRISSVAERCVDWPNRFTSPYMYAFARRGS